MHNTGADLCAHSAESCEQGRARAAPRARWSGWDASAARSFGAENHRPESAAGFRALEKGTAGKI
jgi:hypothetical protein